MGKHLHRKLAVLFTFSCVVLYMPEIFFLFFLFSFDIVFIVVK